MFIRLEYKPQLPPTSSSNIDLIIEMGERELYKHYTVYTVTDELEVIEVIGKYSINEIHVPTQIAGNGDPVMMIKRGPGANFYWENRYFTHTREEAELIALDLIKEVYGRLSAEVERLDILQLTILSAHSTFDSDDDEPQLTDYFKP